MNPFNGLSGGEIKQSVKITQWTLWSMPAHSGLCPKSELGFCSHLAFHEHFIWAYMYFKFAHLQQSIHFQAATLVCVPYPFTSKVKKHVMF